MIRSPATRPTNTIIFVAADVNPLIIPAGEKFEPTHVGCYDGIPAFFQAKFACLLLARRGAGTHEEDAAIHAHVADLHLVGDAAEGDDGPVLKFSMT
jgi:hypothetical protein